MDRPRRAVKRPLTYWEEYVQTDKWYTSEMVRDIPDDEMHAALVDENFQSSEEEEEDESADGTASEGTVATEVDEDYQSSDVESVDDEEVESDAVCEEVSDSEESVQL